MHSFQVSRSVRLKMVAALVACTTPVFPALFASAIVQTPSASNSKGGDQNVVECPASLLLGDARVHVALPRVASMVAGRCAQSRCLPSIGSESPPCPLTAAHRTPATQQQRWAVERGTGGLVEGG